ncbi:DNA glycosylase AlkZ-like family protein [Thalassiella azotivora]
MHQLAQQDARRVAVRAQLLDARRPSGVLETVRGLSLLQVEPTAAVAPSAELVLWSRLGSAFRPAQLWDAVDEQRVVELRGALRPAEDVALYRADMEAWPGADAPAWRLRDAEWLRDNDSCRRDVLARLRADGPLRLRDLPDTCVRPWRSTGWNANRNLTMLLDLMVQRGEVAVAGGTGRDRLWDLASRVYPDGPYPPVDEARRLRDERRLRALGIARGKGLACPVEPLDVGEAGEEAVVDGVRGRWRVDPAQLDRPFVGRTALLSPFDRLLHDRKRMRDLFGFEYALEMFKPADRRRWGYYALPVLHDDRLVGKVDARADRSDGVLQVNAVHEDEPLDARTRDHVRAEIEDLGRWLALDVRWPVGA